MSLLLEALKSTDSAGSAGEAAAEAEDEPLDARATLELLAPKSAQGKLSVVPSADGAGPSPDAAGTATIDFAPELTVEAAPAAPYAAQPPLSIAAPAAAVPAVPAVLPAALFASVGAPPVVSAPPGAPPAARAAADAPANARAPVAATPAMSRGKKYGLLLTALAALAGMAMVGKWLWPSGSSTVTYSERRAPQEAPPSADPAPAPSVGAVPVSSARPADQFAYAGNAPEIDLRDAEIHPAASNAPVPPTSGGIAVIARPAMRSMASAAGPAAGSAAGSSRLGHAASALSVTRAEGPSSIDRHVEVGYRALAAGNIATAQNEYLAALELDPNNVDALLGTATAAARDGRSTPAAAAYARVLKLEPGNPDATAALAMLGAGGASGESNESRLKILIAGDDGGRPALHAALGGVYAADARWREAAQEYFVALGKDPGNPDLAFDVAASLDQNRNFAAALTYYRQALAFARQRPTQVDTNAIEQRVGQLQARLETQAAGGPETR